jgi:uncharacterized protein YbjT (DUF2867 family)
MASDKNSHLIAAAKLAKKHGLKNFVAVCPFEHDLAYSEDEKSYIEKVQDAEAEALQANPNMTILKPNLAFGPETHLIHFLAQCAIVGKCPYGNIISAKNGFQFAPVHTDDIAGVIGDALSNPRSGKFSVSGADNLTLR